MILHALQTHHRILGLTALGFRCLQFILGHGKLPVCGLLCRLGRFQFPAHRLHSTPELLQLRRPAEHTGSTVGGAARSWNHPG